MQHLSFRGSFHVSKLSICFPYLSFNYVCAESFFMVFAPAMILSCEKVTTTSLQVQVSLSFQKKTQILITETSFSAVSSHWSIFWDEMQVSTTVGIISLPLPSVPAFVQKLQKMTQLEKAEQTKTSMQQEERLLHFGTVIFPKECVTQTYLQGYMIPRWIFSWSEILLKSSSTELGWVFMVEWKVGFGLKLRLGKGANWEYIKSGRIQTRIKNSTESNSGPLGLDPCDSAG